MFKTHTEELNFLAQLGFPVNPLNSKVTNLEEAWKIANQLEKEKDSLNYPIDGLVVKLDDNVLKDEIGTVGKTPRGWCAIKFATKEVMTKVVGVVWQVGRTGKITPVADLEPVELLGTIVKRASLHNYKQFLELGLEYGDFVIVRKAGDIIPEIVAKVPR